MYIDKKYRDIDDLQLTPTILWLYDSVTLGILGLLDLHFGFNGQLMEQSFQFLVFFWEKEQVKPRSLKLVQSVYQVEICQFAVEGDTYNFRGLIDCFVWGNYASVWNIALQ